MMVKLICAIVDIAGAAFPIDIDTNELVGDFKKVIKAENSRTIACDANDLRLFLAKTDGRWLTEFEVQNGVADISVFEELDVVGAPLNMIGLSEETVSSVAITKELVKAKKTPLHVLVVPSEPVQLQRKLWLVTGTVVNALGSKGIRRHLHLMASLHIGFYDPTRRVDNKNVAFWYEAKNLCFHVLFKSSTCFFYVSPF
uniref:Crinkler effector protein BLC01 n=1 Tax=Bremia lactucae TaxID=4779 RepID=BLC01_BRELC|nr:RecName: Full=Crinkler effector protein BLC01; Flags: Precursor [Bremia lactucae]AYE92117.1 secreted Crinkler [Bremia lactucae]